MNRDRKKTKKPYEISDFYCYGSLTEKDSIDSRYGAAAKELILRKQYPVWGLFIYKELMENVDSSIKAPSVLAYISKEAMILAPRVSGDQCLGLLVALESASGRIIEFSSDDSKDRIVLRLPKFQGKVVAMENCYIDIV